MRSELEKLVASNSGVFDSESPPEGHNERFAAMLTAAKAAGQVKKGRVLRRGLIRTVSLAASVVLMLVLINPLSQMPEDTDPQFAEAAEYFSHQLLDKAERLKALTAYIEPAHRQEVLEDIEMLSRLSLEAIPLGGISQEQQIGLLYEYYQAKSSSLEMIENSITNIVGPRAE